jgi:hypothetical protein
MLADLSVGWCIHFFEAEETVNPGGSNFLGRGTFGLDFQGQSPWDSPIGLPNSTPFLSCPETCSLYDTETDLFSGSSGAYDSTTIVNSDDSVFSLAFLPVSHASGV